MNLSMLVNRIHRYLADQSFYPIVLSSAYAMFLYIGRALFTETWVIYSNLVWNLFLAWIPFGFSMLADALYRFFPRAWWLLILPGALWLLFFPNAPYILTDFFHLTPREGVPMWYDILLLITFSWTGIFLAIASLRTMQRLVKSYVGDFLSWLFVFFILNLSAVGIYLGRFERWNSWDMLSHPRRILIDVLNPLIDPMNSLRFYGVTILFTIFLLICYLMFISMDRPKEQSHATR